MRICVRRLWLLYGMSFVACHSGTSTEDLLSTDGIETAPSFEASSATMNVGEQKTFLVRGGKLPITAKVLGTGTVTVSGRDCTFTTGGTIDSPSIIVTDARGKQASLTIDAVGVEVQPSATSGLALWLKADAMSYPNGTALTSWIDSSSSNADFPLGTQPGTTNPTFVSGFVNGKPVVAFNGSNQYFERAWDSNLNPSQFSLFVVHYPEAVSGAHSPFTSRSNFGGNLRGYHIYIQTPPTLSNSNIGIGGSVWNTLYSLNNVSTNTWYVSEIMVDAQTHSFRQNGVLQGQTSLLISSFLVNPDRPARVGAGTTDSTPSTYFNGKIAEIILFNRALSAGEQQGIRCYLKKKYALSFGC